MKALLLLMVVGLACTKKVEVATVKCYRCQVGAFNGIPGYNTEVCTNQIDTIRFQNAQGQNLGSICEEK